MSSLQARHRGHNIPDGVTTFNEIEYDREGGVFLNRTKLLLLCIIVFLLTAVAAILGRYSAESELRQYINPDSLIKKAGVDPAVPFLAVEPESYKVFIHPHLYAEDGTVPKHDVEYNGRVEVIFRPRTDTSVISLHVGPLLIDKDPLLKRREHINTPTEKVLEDKYQFVITTEVDETQETMTVTVGEPLRMGQYYSLFVTFKGTIGRNPANGGFFKVVFDDKEAVKNRWYVATKLEPHKARNLMPCVDNPKHKAYFEMSVVRNKDTTVIFNTKLKNTEPYEGELLLDQFEKTGLIRPDSLGLFMSNFKARPVPTTGTVTVSAWSPEPTDSIEIITEVVPKTLDFMTSYLDTGFPTNKLDIVVVPSASVSSAESPGLIVLEDSALATEQKSSAVDYQKSMEAIVVHVIRQWLMPLRGLGQTSKEDNWLHEAMAQFLKIVNIDHIKPSWDFGARYPLDTIQKVMFYDSWTNTEPLAYDDDRTDNHQNTSPSKGTAILHMLNNTFTEDVFKQALKEYLTVDMYRRYEINSFWTILEDKARNSSVHLPENSAVLQIVSTWTRNKNYPLVSLNVDGDDLILKQFRFEYDEPKPTNDWIIPVTLSSGATNSTLVWLENQPETRVSGYVSASNGTCILANLHQTGYFRVSYDDSLLDKIEVAISKGGVLDDYTIAQVICDLFEGALAGVTTFNNALGVLDRVIQNATPTYGYWEAIYTAFAKMESILHSTRHHGPLSIFMEAAVKRAYGLFQNNANDKPSEKLEKMDTLSIAGRMELSEYVIWAKNEFQTWKTKAAEPNPIEPNNRESVYCTVMRYATKTDRRFMLDQYKLSESTMDRKALARSFSCSQNSIFLNKIMSLDDIKEEDSIEVWESFANNPTAGPIMFHYLRNNWEKLYKEYLDSNRELLVTMLRTAIRGSNSLADLENVNSFTEKYFGVNVENRDLQLLDILRFEEEILRQKISWREKYETVISSWITPRLGKSKFYTEDSDGLKYTVLDGKTPEAGKDSETDKPDGHVEKEAHVNEEVVLKPLDDKKDLKPPEAEGTVEGKPEEGKPAEGKPEEGQPKKAVPEPNKSKSKETQLTS